MKTAITTIRSLARYIASWLDFAPQSSAVTNSTQALEKERRRIKEIDAAILKRHVVGAEKEAALQERARLRRKVESAYETARAIIQNSLEAIRDCYAKLYEAWTGEPFPAGRHPVPLDDDIWLGRGCRLAGMLAAALDVILVAFLMRSYYGWLAVLLGALVPTFCLTLILDKVITVATRRDALRRSLYLIGRVFWPALILTLLCLIVILAQRYVSGMPELVAVVYDGLVSLATLLVTPSLMLLGGSLLAMGNLFMWSLPLSKNYEELLRQRAELDNDQNDFWSDPPSFTNSNPPPRSVTPNLSATATAIAFVLAASALLTGCGEVSKPATAQSSARETTSTIQAKNTILTIEVDQSGSIEPQAGHAAAQNLYQQLVPILIKLRAVELRLRHFGADGWSAPVTLTVTWSPLQEPTGEYVGLPNRRPEWEARQKKLREDAWKQYQTHLEEAVAQAKVTAALLDPATEKAAVCSDVYGTLARISAGRRGAREEIYIVLTDGYDTCNKGVMPPLKPPQGNVQVLVLVTAAVAQEGEGKRPQQQFASREEALKKIAPWAQIVAAHEGNLTEMMRTPQAQAAGESARREPQTQ